MQAVLDGGEPEIAYEQDLLFDVGVTIDDGRGEDTAQDAIPRVIMEAMPTVEFFAYHCVAHGAPEWLRDVYDNAVAAMVRAVAESRMSPPSPERGRARRERSSYSTERLGYSTERPGYRNTGLQRFVHELQAGQYDSIYQRIARQNGLTESQMWLGNSLRDSSAVRQIIQENRRYQRVLEELPPAARQAVARDLYERLNLIAGSELADGESGKPEDSDSA